jgi:hypothetical protein
MRGDLFDGFLGASTGSLYLTQMKRASNRNAASNDAGRDT